MLRQTLARADELRLPVVLLPSWYDVDDAAALRQLIGELVEGRPFRTVGSKPTPAGFTRRHLLRLLRRPTLASSSERVARSSLVA